LQNLNYALAEDLISVNYLITLVIAKYNKTTREFIYANAGHIYPLLWSYPASLAQPQYLTTRSVPLGIFPELSSQSGRLILAPKDTLLLLSDGITEAKVTISSKSLIKNNSGTQALTWSILNQEGIWQLIREQPQPLSLEQLIAQIQSDNPVQEDDQTILSLEIL